MPEQYQPGVCNIGQAEIRHRKNAHGWGGVALTIALFVILYFLRVSGYVYVLLLPTLYLASLGFLQAKNRFCVAYGKSGLSNLNGEVGETTDVIGRSNREKDLKKSKIITQNALKISTALTLLIAIIISKFY